MANEGNQSFPRDNLEGIHIHQELIAVGAQTDPDLL